MSVNLLARLAVAAAMLAPVLASAGPTLDAVKQKGALRYIVDDRQVRKGIGGSGGAAKVMAEVPSAIRHETLPVTLMSAMGRKQTLAAIRFAL